MKRNNNRGYYYCNEKLKQTLDNNLKFRRFMIRLQNSVVKWCKLPGNLCIRCRDLMYADKRQYEATMKRKIIAAKQLLEEK